MTTGSKELDDLIGIVIVMLVVVVIVAIDARLNPPTQG